MFALSHERRNRFLLIGGLAFLILAGLWAARGALFPYILALLLAYLMLPVVNWLERALHQPLRLRKPARPVAILLVYLLTAGLVAMFISMVVPVLIQQFDAMWANRDAITSRAQDLSTQGLAWYRQNVPEQIQTQVDDGLKRAGGTVMSAVQTGVTRTFSIVTSTVSFILGMMVIPFWLFYVLYDQSRVSRALHNLIADRYWPDFYNLMRIVDRILSAYIRGQIILSLMIGLMAVIGLMVLRVQFAALLGLIAALLEFLPFIGPILGAIPAVIIATIQSPVLGLWTILLFLGIQQIENIFLAPRISGRAVELHPALIMVVLVVGNEVAGLWGMLVVVPLTAILRDVFRYLYLRFQDVPVPPAEAMSRLGRWS